MEESEAYFPEWNRPSLTTRFSISRWYSWQSRVPWVGRIIHSELPTIVHSTRLRKQIFSGVWMVPRRYSLSYEVVYKRYVLTEGIGRQSNYWPENCFGSCEENTQISACEWATHEHTCFRSHVLTDIGSPDNILAVLLGSLLSNKYSASLCPMISKTFGLSFVLSRNPRKP
jgi:hypothetical protein